MPVEFSPPAAWPAAISGRRRKRCFALPLILLLTAAGLGQQARPTVRATRVTTAPLLDGVLDDAVWAQAEVLDDFTQFDPVEGAQPSERTEVRVLFDSRRLYLGLRCEDGEPGKLISTSMERDAFLGVDDVVEIVFDTFGDRRNAYFFQINPGGSLGDARITNNGDDFNKPWDGIWDARTSTDAGGWNAELAIPFATLTFDENLSTWGFNVERLLGRKREGVRWASPVRNRGIFRVADAGLLTGLEGLEQGIGLDVVPFVVGSWRNDELGLQGEGSEFDAGLDAFYRLTPGLTLGLTLNTDFAETEVDQRRVNLTRFPLFFPEQRDFFLQDSALFEMGGADGDVIPFFSRRIGLSPTGVELPIDVGAKLSGQSGPWKLGLLGVTTDDEAGIPGEDHIVARISHDVGQQSNVGLLYTQGNPAGIGDEQTFGFDGNFRTSTFAGNKNVEAGVWALRTSGDGPGGDSYGAFLAWPNDIWEAYVGGLSIDEDFDPGLGFVPRKGIRKYDAGMTFQPRIEKEIRSLELSWDGSWVTDLDDQLETAEQEFQPLGIQWESGEMARVEMIFSRDRLTEDFEISDGIVIDQGSYDFVRTRFEFETSETRPLALELTQGVGDFFDGERDQLSLGLVWRVNPQLTFELEGERNEVSLLDGDFDTEIVALRANVSFNPRLSWNSFLQWDSVSDTYGAFSRLRWIRRPGEEFNLVLNETVDNDFDPLVEELAFKLSYTLRF